MSTPAPTIRELAEALGQWLLASAHAPHRHRLTTEANAGALRPLIQQVLTHGEPSARTPTMRWLLTLLAAEAKIQGLRNTATLAAALNHSDDPATCILRALKAGTTR